jgi:two-component system, cell cycle response regulator
MAPRKDQTVFVVDDSATTRELVVQLVQQLGVKAMPFASGQMALGAMEVYRPALVLLDLEMPGMDGDEVCRRIKQNPTLRKTPVVMVSAKDEPSDTARYFNAGADDYLPKPIRKSALAQKIAAITESPTEQEAELERRRPRNVLLVEPDEEARSRIGNSLEHAGYRMLYARAQSEAMALMQDSRDLIDAVVVSLSPPWILGVDLIKAVRSTDPKNKMPLMVMSGFEVPAPVQTELKRAFNLTIVDKRGLNADQLIARVHFLLKRLNIELRVAKRDAFYAAVDFRKRGDREWQSSYCTDLSVGGVFLKTLNALAPSTELDLEIRLSRTIKVQCTGLVAWSNNYVRDTKLSFPVGMGIKFKEISAKNAEYLRGLLAAPGQAVGGQ